MTEFTFDCHQFDEDGGVVATWRVEFTATPGDPGCVTGPIERCYPPEGGEVDVLSAARIDRPWVTSRADMDALYGDADLLDACYEHAETQWADDADGPEYDPDDDGGPDDWMD